ncbi:hypothetical protein DPSP01_002167 [Paraphaeosphaeria sporulosa]
MALRPSVVPPSTPKAFDIKMPTRRDSHLHFDFIDIRPHLADQLDTSVHTKTMTRYTNVVDSLQNMRHGTANSGDPSSEEDMAEPVSPTTLAADDAVQAQEAEVAANPPSSSVSTTIAASASDYVSDFDNDGLYAKNQHAPPQPSTFQNSGFTPTPGITYIYKISAPKPTLTLPPTHPFRTTPAGYPVFRPHPSAHHATLSTAPGFADPRLTAFTAHWTKIYTDIGNNSTLFSVGDGLFELRQACELRGLVTYGVVQRLVERLVDRAVRDAGRGWCEVRVGMERVEVLEAPEVPVAVEDDVGDDWWEEVSYGG